MKIFSNIFKKPQQFQRVALITNFNSCPLGLNLADKFLEHIPSTYDKLVLVSPDAEKHKLKEDSQKVLYLDAFINS